MIFLKKKLHYYLINITKFKIAYLLSTNFDDKNYWYKVSDAGSVIVTVKNGQFEDNPYQDYFGVFVLKYIVLTFFETNKQE